MSKNKDEINLKSLSRVYLQIITNKDGYIIKNAPGSFHCIDWNPGINWKEEQLSYCFTKPIIIEKPSKLSIPSVVKEYLTGEPFKYARYIIGNNEKIKSKHDKLDVFALDIYNLHSNFILLNSDESLTTNDLFNYMKENGNVDEYRKKLQSFKENSQKLGIGLTEKTNKEERIEKEKISTEANKRLLLEVGLETLKNNSRIIEPCLEIMSDDDYLKSSSIDLILHKIKKEYPYLSNDECVSICIILLKIQSRTDDTNKKLVY